MQSHFRMAFSDEQYLLKLEDAFGVLARNALSLIVRQRVDPCEAACHIAYIMRII